AGNYARGWSAPAGAKVDWPKSEHGIYLDPEGNVWIAGNGDEDNQILKFTPEGRFLMQIGRAGKSEGSASHTQLGRPAHMVMDAQAQELYVADGYGNRQVGAFGRTGRMAGEFKWVHNIAIDRQGNLYTAEVGFGRRAQKFTLLSF